MNTELIERLAREAGFVDYELDDGTMRAFDLRYARFAALVAETLAHGIETASFTSDATPQDVQAMFAKAVRLAFPMPGGIDEPQYVVTWLEGPRPPEPLGPNDLGVIRHMPKDCAMKFEELQCGAGNDIWGLTADLQVTVGYDTGAERADPGPLPDWYEGDPLPTAEKMRLADMMIERWTRYRAAVLAKG